MALGIVLGAAVGGTVMVPLGDVAGERHVPARDLQEVAALSGIAHPLGRPQAPFGHSLVFFTRRHGTLRDAYVGFYTQNALSAYLFLKDMGSFPSRKWPEVASAN
jgi:hypothetical protein